MMIFQIFLIELLCNITNMKMSSYVYVHVCIYDLTLRVYTFATMSLHVCVVEFKVNYSFSFASAN